MPDVPEEAAAEAAEPEPRAEPRPEPRSRVLIAKGRMAAPRLVQLDGSRVAVMSRPAEEDGSNEDALLVQQTPRGVLLAVADGVGGLPQGDRAARLALEAISRASVHEDWVVRGMDAAQASVRRLGGACTTLVAAEVSNQRVRFIHCGDAQGIIVGARSHMKLETVSHSPTGFGLAGGFLDEDEALRHDTRHLVCNLIGARPLRYEITGPTKLAKRDTIVLASDGLFDNFRVDEVAALARIRPLEQAARRLAEECDARMFSGLEGTKPDDLTLILWRTSS